MGLGLRGTRPTWDSAYVGLVCLQLERLEASPRTALAELTEQYESAAVSQSAVPTRGPHCGTAQANKRNAAIDRDCAHCELTGGTVKRLGAEQSA